MAIPAIYDNPLPAVIEHEGGKPITRPTATQLSEVIERIGTPHDHWITCSPLPDREGHFIQALRLASGDYQVETREGMDAEITAVQMPAGDEVTIAFLERIRAWAAEPERDSVPTVAAPAVPIEPDAREDAQRMAIAAVAEGFRDFPTIVRDISESSDPARPITPVQARRLLRPIWDARLAEQATWTGTSDNDRLDAAFAALETVGITARQNFSCCLSCGLNDIGAERQDARGFAFYHWQDTEAAAGGDSLYLAYGGFDDSESTTIAVGREVVTALATAGLSPDWDGTAASRIVVPMRWRRPLPA